MLCRWSCACIVEAMYAQWTCACTVQVVRTIFGVLALGADEAQTQLGQVVSMYNACTVMRSRVLSKGLSLNCVVSAFVVYVLSHNISKPRGYKGIGRIYLRPLTLDRICRSAGD